MDNNNFNNDQKGFDESSEIPAVQEVNEPKTPENKIPEVPFTQAENVINNKTESDPADPVSVNNTAEAPKADPTPTYYYTAGSNPNINKDNPTGQGHTSVPPHGVRTTYVPRIDPKPEPKKEKKRRGVPMFVFIICLVAGIVSSMVFGAYGVHVGTQLATGDKSYNGGIIGNESSDGNGSIDAKPSEKVEIDLPEGSIAAAAQSAGDSVVEITTETMTTSFFYGQYVQSGAGSGVIIDADDGYIITCAHVIQGASTVTVTLKNGKNYKAEIVGSDAKTDIAVIKISAKNLVQAEVGNSDNLVVGQTAIAIGNPLGTLGGTVSSGIISALNRDITIDGQGYSLLQIDTSINPGNSGGGLFDVEGKLIGIVNAKSGGDSAGTTIEGLGFAIPVNQALQVANSLVNDGYVSGRANLGIYVYEINQNTNTASLYQSEYAGLLDYITEYGVYFVEYQSGQNGDFEFGDRIIALDGVAVSSRSDISSLLDEYSVGDEISVTVSRVTSDMKRSRIVEFKTTLVENVPETEATEETTEK